MEYVVEEKCEDNATKVIHAAKKGLTAELLRLLRKDEMTCIAAHDKVNYLLNTFITLYSLCAHRFNRHIHVL